MKIKSALLTLLVLASAYSSAHASGPAAAQTVTACAGNDSKGNRIEITISQDNSEKEYSSSHPASISIELTAPSGPVHYTVYDGDSEAGDASLRAKSDDNGGIDLKTEGAGVTTSGTIGVLHSSFRFVDCHAGPAAPMPW